jgi:predicted DNA-binding protein
MTKKRQITIRLEEEILQTLDRKAASLGKRKALRIKLGIAQPTRAAIIRRAIERWLETEGREV